MKNLPFISVILPVHNQADHIGMIVEEYVQALNAASLVYEIILVVNGCRDNSVEVCKELVYRHYFIHLIETKTGGWGLAVRLGIEAATGELICYTNSARTSPQELVLALLYAIANPGVIIKANRKIRENARRRVGSLLYNIECRVLFDLPYWDVNGTPKVFPRACDKLLALTLNDDVIDAEFNAICRREGYRMLEVPVFSARRHGGKSTTKLRSALKMYLGAYKLRRSMEHAQRQAERQAVKQIL